MAHAGDVQIVIAADAATFTAALTKARKQLNDMLGDTNRVSAAGQKAGRDLARAAEGTVAPWMASSAAIRTLEGNITNNIRAAERFIALSPRVAAAAQAMFPIVGAVALTGVVAHLVERIVEYRKESAETARKNEQMWYTIQTATRTANDETQLMIDKIEIANARMERKPENRLKEAIDEAIVDVDKLNDKLDQTLQKLSDTIKGSMPSALQQFLGSASNSDIKDRVDALKDTLDALNLSEGQKLAGVTDKRSIAAIEGQFEGQRANAIAGVQGWMATALAQQKALLPNGRNIWIESSDVKSRIEQLTRAQNVVGQIELSNRLAGLLTSDQNRSAFDQGKTDAARAAAERAEALNRSMPAGKWIDEIGAQVRENTEQLSKEGGNPFLITPKPVYDATGRPNAMPTQVTGAAYPGSDLSKQQDLMKYLEDQGRAAAEWARNVNEGAIIQQRASDAIAETSLRLQVATGQMSRYDAAQARGTLHAQQYAEEMERLNTAARAIETDPTLTPIERRAELQGVDNQRAAATGTYLATTLQDEAEKHAATSLGALRDATDKLTQAFSDLPAHLVELLTSTVNGFNSAFSSAVMTPSHSSQEWRRNMSNAMAGQFRSLGSRGLDAALQLGEGNLLGKFGFGKASKPDGSSAAAALWVRLATLTSGAGASSAASGAAAAAGSIVASTPGMGSNAGGMVSGIVSGALSALAHFAAGGPIPSGLPAIVGENGPELFVPSSSGHIVPNDQLSLGGRGDVHHHWNIDARGANDPSAVEASVHRAMRPYMKQLPAMVPAIMRAHNRGRPGTSRI